MRNSDDYTEYAFRCPGCESNHMIRVKGPEPCWGFNNSLDAPTFTPSIRVRYWDEAKGPGINSCCHSFVTDGKIQFCSDTTHTLSGETMDLPDWDS